MANGQATISKITVMMQPWPPPRLITTTLGRSWLIGPASGRRDRPPWRYARLGTHPAEDEEHDEDDDDDDDDGPDTHGCGSSDTTLMKNGLPRDARGRSSLLHSTCARATRSFLPSLRPLSRPCACRQG